MARKVKISHKRIDNISLNRKPLLFSKPFTTLSEYFVSSEEIERLFKIKKCKNFISRFIELNRETLRFLEVEVEECYEIGRAGLYIHTGRYAGAVPIKSPETSLYTVDLVVKGSYSTHIDDDALYSILSEIGAELLPEFEDQLQLIGNSVKPPIYLECENFINLYTQALKSQWTKFRNEIRNESTPRGATNWTKYALNSHRPEHILRFENHLNIQTKDHCEWRQINYVLDKAIQILESQKTPISARRRNAFTLEKLKHDPLISFTEPTNKIIERATDPPIIKSLKRVANMVLTDSSDLRRSWRLDISKLFEIYVQHVLSKSGPRWQVSTNPHFSISGKKYPWGLAYLEPDMIMHKDKIQIIIDAKYKSNLLGRAGANSSKLKDAFRKDLHQVLAYSAFNAMPAREIFLVYPIIPHKKDIATPVCRISDQTISTPFSNVKACIHIVGIPFGPGLIRPISQELYQLLETIENRFRADY